MTQNSVRACCVGSLVMQLVCIDLSEFILFARKRAISRISLDTDDMTDVVVPVTGLQSVVALDWDSSTTDLVYWTDDKQRTISSARWDGTQQQVLYFPMSVCHTYMLAQTQSVRSVVHLLRRYVVPQTGSTRTLQC